MKGIILALSGILLLAAPGAARGQFGYETNADNTNTITITNYTGPGGVVTIPTNITGLLVTGIGTSAFQFTANLTSVSIPDSVTVIGANAFADCASLTNIAIGTGVTNIGEYAFYFCSGLPSVTIPGSVTSIGADAFAKCDTLTDLTIGNGVSNIGPSAFQFCGVLTSVTIPASVTSIGADAFANCLRLTEVYFRGNAPSADATVFSSDSSATICYLSGATGWSSPFAGIPAEICNSPIQTGWLQVTIVPAAAVTAGAQWVLDGGTNQNSGVLISNLSSGSHIVSFTSNISGWNTPPNQTVTITNGAITFASGIYTQTNAGLVLLTNGSGTIRHGAWPDSLVIGKQYMVTAAPKYRNVFVNWVGGTAQPYSVLSSATGYTFTNQPNLLLEANFETNYFAATQGTYRGLFAPSSVRQQTNSGAFVFSVTGGGAVSGNLNLGGQAVAFSGKFNLGGSAIIPSKPVHGILPLSLSLQLDFSGQTVGGTVSNSAFTAELFGYRDVFSSADKATDFEGQYTLVIPGVNDPTVGPFGAGYGTVKVSPSGTIMLAGSLADGTAISQSSVVSQDGYWPLYLSLYGGKGSLWGWNYFANQNLAAPAALSWINTTNSAKAAVYRSGFTNQEAVLVAGRYLPGQPLPSGEVVTLQETNPPLTITITNLLANTNRLILKTNPTTGVISGRFANPANSKQTIKVNGVILQSAAQAQGYFLATNQSGAFLLDRP